MRDYAIARWGRWPCHAEKVALDGHQVIVANDQDVGCVATILHPDHLWLDELYIAPAFQRRGLGSAVLTLVFSEAKERNLSLRLSVLTTNPAL